MPADHQNAAIVLRRLEHLGPTRVEERGDHVGVVVGDSLPANTTELVVHRRRSREVLDDVRHIAYHDAGGLKAPRPRRAEGEYLVVEDALHRQLSVERFGALNSLFGEASVLALAFGFLVGDEEDDREAIEQLGNWMHGSLPGGVDPSSAELHPYEAHGKQINSVVIFF